MHRWLLLFPFLIISTVAEALEAEAEASIEYRQFFREGALGQKTPQFSATFLPTLYWESEEGGHSITWTTLFRADSLDENRSHIDVREAYYQTYFDLYGSLGELALKVGAAQVFWGVTESQNIVNVINQSDLVDNVTGEKLGQPMINVNLDSEFGFLELYVLPVFRERTFASESGRLAFPGVVNNPIYESSRRQKKIDLGFRYSYSFDSWDIGFSAFTGTNREPYFAAQVNTPVDEDLSTDINIVPYYAKMTQLGIDFQAFIGDFTWKLEAIRRESLVNHTAVTTGFEYTFVGIFDTDNDLTLFSEYLYDSRDPTGPVSIQLDRNTQVLLLISDTLFGGLLTPDFDALADERRILPTFANNDIFTGARWVLNDINGTEVRVGWLMDIEYITSHLLQYEVSGRFDESLSWKVEGTFFNSEDKQDPLFGVKDDDFVKAALTYYF
ncbi:hypothetical protein [Veronia pacifica]|uniref:DUF1302 domain-containing protein n=1 Tax=Veronia pacifica TaxID=1080227 RepID=A0A1C3ERX5_9GAMM|nr:hypothetical protein [Veronia pacifica]ODA35938.1 hypothetical protein A8L45_02600 [Veronia pacifica]